MRIRSAIAHGLLACAIGSPTFAQAPAITLALDCRNVATTELRLTVRNGGSRDSAVMLGESVGNGRRYLANAFALDVKRGPNAVIETYSYFDPSVGAIAGRLDPWVVQLPVDATFSLTRPIGHFWSAGAPLTLNGSSIDIRLKLAARVDRRVLNLDWFGLIAENVFVGEVSSEWRHVPADCTADQDRQANTDDAQVLSAAIAHYSDVNRKQGDPPRVVIAGETAGAESIRLGAAAQEIPEVPDSAIRQLRERGAGARGIPALQLPWNVTVVRDAIGLTRHVMPSGAHVTDWSPFTHAYPGSELMQLAAPTFFGSDQKALVYFWAGSGPESLRGWIYLLEKRGTEWHVTRSHSPWVA